MMQQAAIRKSVPVILGLMMVAGCQPETPSAIDAGAITESTLIVVNDPEISADFPFEKKRVEVNGSHMAYVDEGEGSVVLFLHGNPTSSYLWRNIIPYVTDTHRAIAVDLIGMGDSGKPNISYTFEDHATYLDSFIEALDLTDVTLVIHDWGSALGMRYARLNEENVRGLVFMEAIVPPVFPAPSFEALGENGELFRNLRTPGVGEQLVLEENFFVETILPEFGVLRPLTAAEMSAYRAPFLTPESRIPTLQWPREVPIGGEPASTTAEIAANGEWLTTTDLPKLFFYAEPGAIIPAPAVEFLKANVKNMESISIGPGLHFIQEDNPHAIGEGLSAWLERSR
ncbi:MAG: haloalkane dehalogenase [Phormidesmis sp.]